jgi:DNA invertase Pin-like site-specific DNA recombinase
VLKGIPLVEIVADEAVSASQVPFLRRPNGGRLDATVVRGDHIVVAKLDRAFRSLRDCAVMMDHWTARGVVVHVLDISVATDTPLGQLIVAIMAAVAQWESRRIGERIRDAMAVKRAQGRSPNGRPQLGYRVGPDQFLLADEEMQRVVARIVRWKDRHHLRYEEIVEKLNLMGSRTTMGREWKIATLAHACRFGRTTTWEQLLADDDPCPVPTVTLTSESSGSRARRVREGSTLSSPARREAASMARRNVAGFAETGDFLRRVGEAVREYERSGPVLLADR